MWEYSLCAAEILIPPNNTAFMWLIMALSLQMKWNLSSVTTVKKAVPSLRWGGTPGFAVREICDRCSWCLVNKREIELTKWYFNASDPVLCLYVSLHFFQQEKLLSCAEGVAKLILSNVLLLLSTSFHQDIFGKVCVCSFAAGCFIIVLKTNLLEWDILNKTCSFSSYHVKVAPVFLWNLPWELLFYTLFSSKSSELIEFV